MKRDYKKKQALVKWLGYSDNFNGWIPLSNLQTLSNQYYMDGHITKLDTKIRSKETELNALYTKSKN